jgi:hypothetical protein
MGLRNLLLGLALLAAPWVASAQEQTREAPVAAPAEVSTNSAVRDVYHALFFDSGIFDTMTSEFLPEYRRQATSSVYYRRASGERREALDRVIEATPQYMREEITAETFVMADNVSERAAALLSANDIAMLANFLRDPNWRPFMARMALQGANKGPESIGADDLSAEEEAQMNDYAETHFSPQLMENGGAFMDLLVGEMRAASPRLQPRIQRRLAVEICAALDDRCPRELRDQIRTL